MAWAVEWAVAFQACPVDPHGRPGDVARHRPPRLWAKRDHPARAARRHASPFPRGVPADALRVRGESTVAAASRRCWPVAGVNHGNEWRWQRQSGRSGEWPGHAPVHRLADTIVRPNLGAVRVSVAGHWLGPRRRVRARLLMGGPAAGAAWAAQPRPAALTRTGGRRLGAASPAAPRLPYGAGPEVGWRQACVLRDPRKHLRT